VAYSFGRHGGLIDVAFAEQERLNTRRDRVVVGFRTTLSEPGAATASTTSTTSSGSLLARVVSATSNDFVELSLVSFFLFLNACCLL